MENTCSICGVKYKGFGNNAQPINNGRCCDACNQEVIYQRIQEVVEGVDFDAISKLRTKLWLQSKPNPKKLCKNEK